MSYRTVIFTYLLTCYNVDTRERILIFLAEMLPIK